MDWTKNFGRKQVGRKQGARFQTDPFNNRNCVGGNLLFRAMNVRSEKVLSFDENFLTLQTF